MAPEKYLLVRKAALTHPLVPLSPGEEWAWGRAEEAGRAGDQCQQPQRIRARQRTRRDTARSTQRSGAAQQAGRPDGSGLRQKRKEAQLSA